MMRIGKYMVLSAALSATLFVGGVGVVHSAPAQTSVQAKRQALEVQDRMFTARLARLNSLYGSDNPRILACKARQQAIRKALKHLLPSKMPDSSNTSQEIIARSRVYLLSQKPTL